MSNQEVLQNMSSLFSRYDINEEFAQFLPLPGKVRNFSYLTVGKVHHALGRMS